MQGTQNLVLEKGHIIFVIITTIKGTGDLYSEERDIFLWVRKPGFILTSIISGDTSALKKWLTTKRADIFKCTLVKNGSFPKLNCLT